MAKNKDMSDKERREHLRIMKDGESRYFKEHKMTLKKGVKEPSFSEVFEAMPERRAETVWPHDMRKKRK